jgi:phosphatidylserine/phosphatidylglycerophosphate/cardiolipin synthase-like enzyme
MTTVLHAVLPPPASVGLAGLSHAATSVKFLHDDSWLDPNGKRHLDQAVFDEIFRIIRQAERFILVDMFLFNDWQGPAPETHRALADEFTRTLIERKSRNPDIQIIVISDPINTVYGGLDSPHFRALREASIPVVLTDLARLQDSNPAWSGFWRVAVQPFGNGPGQLLPNPFGAGRVSLRSYLALLNFKANHRKLIVADQPDGELLGLVSSANPHDGSSAHRNVALSFAGPAVLDLLVGERALLAMNGAETPLRILDEVLEQSGVNTALQAGRDVGVIGQPVGDAVIPPLQLPQVQVLNELRIQEAVVTTIARSGQGDVIDLAMFYLSERSIIEALKSAHDRGAALRVLLDVNQDAFGRKKNGVPNRPVAAELVAAGIPVRWCATSGEQCHSKWLHVAYGNASKTASNEASQPDHEFVLGSANFTRRNLRNLNMETSVLVRTGSDDPVAAQMILHFEEQWRNLDARTYSLDYESFADDSLWLRLQYRFMESTGLSTF